MSRKSSRACPPWGDEDDPEEEEKKSSDPPKIAGEYSPPSALHAENSLANDQTGLVLVSNRHMFKMPSPSSSSVTTDSEDDKSPSLDHASSTEKILGEIIEGTTAYREYIRSGGSPKNNEQ